MCELHSTVHSSSLRLDFIALIHLSDLISYIIKFTQKNNNDFGSYLTGDASSKCSFIVRRNVTLTTQNTQALEI
jgi:hypothetical protein